jgi:HPt (histidine-containing phosphotransfer) domain-containing protein
MWLYRVWALRAQRIPKPHNFLQMQKALNIPGHMAEKPSSLSIGRRHPLPKGETMQDGTPIIDIPEALNRAMGDVDFLKEMLEELHRSIPDFTSRIQHAMQSDNAGALGSDAHQFKGAAANLGAKALAHAALQLEQIGKSGSLEGAQEAFDRLEQAIEAFVGYLKEIDWTTIAPI